MQPCALGGSTCGHMQSAFELSPLGEVCTLPTPACLVCQVPTVCVSSSRKQGNLTASFQVTALNRFEGSLCVAVGVWPLMQPGSHPQQVLHLYAAPIGGPIHGFWVREISRHNREILGYAVIQAHTPLLRQFQDYSSCTTCTCLSRHLPHRNTWLACKIGGHEVRGGLC